MNNGGLVVIVKTSTKLLPIYLIILLVSACIGQGTEDMKKEIEQLLGIALPDGVGKTQYVYQPETGEFNKPYTAYIQAEMSETEYIDFISALGLNTVDAGGAFQYLLPGTLLPDSRSPSWWQISAPNQLTATGAFNNAENFGWIVATYEDGKAYIKAFEQAKAP